MQHADPVTGSYKQDQDGNLLTCPRLDEGVSARCKGQLALDLTRAYLQDVNAEAMGHVEALKYLERKQLAELSSASL